MAADAWSRWRSVPRRHPVWSAVAAVLVLLVIVLAVFDWNWARRPIERLVTASTGREFHIDGNLDVDFFPLEVHAEGLRLANAAWSAEPQMAAVERVDARIRFWPLLAGRVTLPALRVERPVLHLERDAEGLGNWNFGREPSTCAGEDCPSRLRIQQLHVRDGSLRFLEPTYETAVDIRFDSIEPAEGGVLAPLVLTGSGTYRRARFELEGRVDSPLALQQADLPYQLDLTAAAGDTRARIHGALAEPLQIEDVSVDMEASGADLADLYEFTGIVLPTTPPYALKGRLSRHGNRFSYEDFTGTVGDSDMSGDAHFDIGGVRPKLTAVLSSQRIDFDDLAGFIGGTPSTEQGEAASARQQKEAGRQRATGRRLPGTPINLSRLRAMDADVRLQASRVDSRRLPLQTMTAHLLLEDGVMKVDPLDFGAAGGKLDSTVNVDARRDPATFAFDMKLQHLQLPKLMPRVKLMQDSVGTLSGTLKLAGAGNTAAAAMASANGEFNMIMGRGRMSNLMLEIAGLDIAESLAFLIGKDKQVELECAYADFAVVNGVATARSVALDTTDTALLLRGDIDFRDESLDLTLLPKPKDPSPLSIRTPLRIRGTFMQPEFGLKAEPLLLRGAAVGALIAIAPPLGLLGLVETGPGKNQGCSREEPREEPSPGARTPPGPRPPPGAPLRDTSRNEN